MLNNANGIRMVYSCIGYGVMSFWAAFIIANTGNMLKKIKWILAGWFAIWCINVLRISLLIISQDKHWPMPLGFDHHTWFNIFAYLLILIMIYFFDRSSKKNRGLATEGKINKTQEFYNDNIRN